MFAKLFIYLSIPFLLQACQIDGNGDGWTNFELTEIKDYARAGPDYDNVCYNYCSATDSMFMNMKVLLAQPSVNPKLAIKNFQKVPVAKPDDANPYTCADSGLRQKIANVLTTLNDYSCKGVVRSLSYSLNKPKWFISCTVFQYGGGGAYYDDNFCYYTATVHGTDYTLVLAAIDSN